uniref:Uncharacterized protein n=1 Tax=Lepeophtheirus salmonis TaxID=72036 RepID=A0A0K2V2E6_LEPSM
MPCTSTSAICVTSHLSQAYH